ncbi:MAG: ribbon-helix-helix protein, CopG family [Acidobacteria bacterium]|nr:ribbon-helix-helix protein, CopG family [Acidobacteriota bacterium]
MRRTTIYLPDDLKKAVEDAARRDGRSEATVIREALESALKGRGAPRPRIPLVREGLGEPNVARRVDELLEGFGK